jgi:hypothetical protein
LSISITKNMPETDSPISLVVARSLIATKTKVSDECSMNAELDALGQTLDGCDEAHGVVPLQKFGVLNANYFNKLYEPDIGTRKIFHHRFFSSSARSRSKTFWVRSRTASSSSAALVSRPSALCLSTICL